MVMAETKRKPRPYKQFMRPLTEEDKLFIKLVGDGEPKAVAFKKAYPNHQNVTRYFDAVKDKQDAKHRMYLSQLIYQAAKNKLQTQRVHSALVTYKSKMAIFSEHSVDTAIDLVQNARSEKVRADLAIEGMRHEVGTPVQKVAIQEEKTVYITFDKPKPVDAPANRPDVIDV